MHKTFAFIITFVSAAFSSIVLAHPHNWISVNSHFTLDSQSRVAQITQTWEFDVYYSTMTFADLANENKDEAQALNSLATKMIKNLKSYDYFSKLSVDQKTIELKPPASYQLKKVIRDNQPILVLEMTFDISVNASLERSSLTWQVFDPTYYIAMNHNSLDNISIKTTNGTECSLELFESKPSDDLVQYAQDLDANQRDTQGLGIQFAEEIQITCI